jgi:hypothetical protein
LRRRTLIKIRGTTIMPNFINLPPFAEDGAVHVVVETPRGSRAKFAYTLNWKRSRSRNLFSSD